MSEKFRIAIAGASGYAGAELVRLAAAHPYFTITAVTSEKSAGQSVSSVFPSFKGIVDHQFEALAPEALTERADAIFLPCLTPNRRTPLRPVSRQASPSSTSVRIIG